MDELEQEQGETLEQSSDVLNDLGNIQVDNDDFTTNQAELEQEEKESLPTSQLVLMAISPLFDVFAPNWGVEDSEKEALAGAYAEVIDEYFPDIEASPIVGAVIVTGMVFAPRIGTPRVLEKKDDLIMDEASGD